MNFLIDGVTTTVVTVGDGSSKVTVVAEHPKDHNLILVGLKNRQVYEIGISPSTSAVQNLLFTADGVTAADRVQDLDYHPSDAAKETLYVTIWNDGGSAGSIVTYKTLDWTTINLAGGANVTS